MAETVEPVESRPTEDEAEESLTRSEAEESLTGDEAEESLTEDEAEESLTGLLEELGHEVGALAFYESRLAASRHEPELRRAGLGAAAATVVVVALLAAFVLANAAAVAALTPSLPDWAAPLVLAAGWAVLGVAVALVLRSRAKRFRVWHLEDAEAAREEAEQAVRATLDRLAPTITKEIALAAVPTAGGVAAGVVDVSEDLIEGADDIVEAVTEGVPGAGVVNQMWDVVLMPGRFGIRVATTVLRR